MEAEEYVKCPDCEGLGYDVPLKGTVPSYESFKRRDDFGKECSRCLARGYLVMLLWSSEDEK